MYGPKLLSSAATVMLLSLSVVTEFILCGRTVSYSWAVCDMAWPNSDPVWAAGMYTVSRTAS